MKKQLLWIIFCGITILSALVCTYIFSNAVTAMVETMPVSRTHTIIIDAGHGGLDGGATSCTGRLESVYNLEIASCLEDFMKLLGYQTRMIRKTDESVYKDGATVAAKKLSDLKERVRIANEPSDALLLSIHQNHYPDSRYHGAVVLYANTPGSDILARDLQTALVCTLNPGSTRKCKKAEGIYLMKHITCTGILVECGFLSNPMEEARLRDPEYQKKLSCVIGCTVSNYYSKGPKIS